MSKPTNDKEGLIMSATKQTNLTRVTRALWLVAGLCLSLLLSTSSRADGTLWSMGNNEYGQLGTGDEVDQSSPQEVVGDVVAIAAGEDHTLFLDSDGALWGMGQNYFYSQLGTHDWINHSTPVKIVESGVVAVAAGGVSSMFIDGDGALWAMGSNYYGQLGSGETRQWYSLPTKVVSSGVVAAAMGARS